jgi:F-type H+-transporting ATPase subunit b
MSFNWATFFFEILNFLVLAYILHWLLYRPIHEAIERRRESVASAQREAEKIRQEASELQQRLQKEMGDLERKREQTARADRDQALQERRKLLSDAQTIVLERRREFEESLARDRKQMLDDVRAEVVQQAVDLARRLLSEAADRTLHRQLCLHLIEAINDLPAEDRERIRQAWRAGDTVELQTARELDAETLSEVTSVIAAVLGQRVSPEVRLCPSLMDGVRLRVGGQVWDSSLVDHVPQSDHLAAADANR